MIGLLRKRSCISVRKLDPADYVIGDVGVERKTVADFLASLKSSRLFEQVSRLKLAYSSAYLIVEGLIDWSDFKNPYWVCFALQRIVLLGVPIFFSSSQQNSVKLLYQLGIKQRISCEPRVVMKSYKSSHRQLSVLCSFPMIGEKRATELLKEFSTLRKAFSADYGELRHRGIGKKTARVFVTLLDLRYGEK